MFSFAFAMLPLCFSDAFPLRFLCVPYAFFVLSLCSSFVFPLPSLCFSYAFLCSPNVVPMLSFAFAM
jgi:hypothetical protein